MLCVLVLFAGRVLGQEKMWIWFVSCWILKIKSLNREEFQAIWPFVFKNTKKKTKNLD